MNSTQATTTATATAAATAAQKRNECDAAQTADTLGQNARPTARWPPADPTNGASMPPAGPTPGKVFAYECHVETGSPDRTLRSAPAVGVAAPRTAFDGECYLCGGEGHSQNYCPLSRCHTCHRYGHTERACCFAARPWGLHTTAAATAATAAAKKTHHRHVYGGRAMFGSGWHGSAPPRTSVVGWR
ncbi:hypothetical protein psal_cds_373 [Pandoravirus salinus]|uniref:CCHC-type domain-containing protein n=1 Tax=Pandoravirus salinus TaxID=1349410 RepID=S4VX75_9VIRU|nr:hypothetical protein psal_cds_373 [Pandoravirus salinus]AGO84046.1 hypothetical protein psal_cds_373 [Pandoravirus salinus]